MAATRRESSADSAARFLRTYRGPQGRFARRGPSETELAARRMLTWLAQVDALARCAPPDRALVDFNRATLRAIHKVLCDAMAPREHRPEHYTGELLNLIVIAEQMVGRALGYPDCDDPPLTDREVPR